MSKKLIINNLKDVFDFGFEKPFEFLSLVEKRFLELEPGEPLEVVYLKGVFNFEFKHYQMTSKGKSISRYEFLCGPF